MLDLSEIDTYNRDRIQVLQDLTGMTQNDLSAKCGLSVRSIHSVKTGVTPFTLELARGLSFGTGFPLSFFQSDFPMAQLFELTNRRNSRTSPKEKRHLGSEYNLLRQAVSRSSIVAGTDLNTSHKLIDSLAPSGEVTGEDIERIAFDTRTLFGAGIDMPIPSVIRMLERSLIVVAPLMSKISGLPEYDMGSEGVSLPREGEDNPLTIGYIVNERPGDRQRFTVAHELGHLILHKYRRVTDNRVMEKEAHRFAGAFLIPASAVRRSVSAYHNLHDYAVLKSQWGVSVAALIRRAFDVGVIDADRYKSLQMQVGARGWRKREPVRVDPEHPLLFKQLVGKAFGQVLGPSEVKVSLARVVQELGVPYEYVSTWADGLGEEPGLYDEFDEIVKGF